MSTSITRALQKVVTKRSPKQSAGCAGTTAAETDLPKTKHELRERIITDLVFWLETFCSVRDYSGKGIVPLRLNAGQRRYWTEIVKPGIQRDLDAKSRKYGHTTFRIGESEHGICYREGRTARIVVPRWQTALTAAQIADTLYTSARKILVELARIAGVGDNYFIPQRTSDSRFRHELGETQSVLCIETAAGQGVGQADRSDDLYLTEYADWEHPEAAYDGLIGSVPVGMPDTRVTIDFNANETWLGSDAYVLWSGANAKGDDWNGYKPFFVGVLDVPEVYSAEHLDTQRRAMRERYRLSYPETTDDLMYQRDRCVFPLGDIRTCTTDGYIGDAAEKYLHGVDTATGMVDGDWQTCVTLGWDGERWVEACEPIRERIAEDVFAEHVDSRARQYPGTVVVERNVGSAVLVKLRELATPGLYRHRDRDRDGKQVMRLGYATTYSSKRVMIADTRKALSDGTVAIATPDLIRELSEYEWATNAEGDQRREIASAPSRRGAHDDLVMAFMLALQGQHVPYAERLYSTR